MILAQFRYYKSEDTMDHPEMKQALQEAMRAGLRWDSTLTPQQIRERVRRQMTTFKAKDLVGEVIWDKCTCGFADGYTLGMYVDGKRTHYEWCQAKPIVKFKNEPEPNLDGFYYKPFRIGRSFLP